MGLVVRAELRARRVERPLEESASAAFRGTNEDDRAERFARARVPAPVNYRRSRIADNE